ALQFPIRPDRRIEGDSLDLALAVTLAETVLTRVQRNLAQPRRDLAFPAEGAECPVGIDERVLGEIGRFFAVADLAEDQVVDPLVVLLHQFIEREQSIFVVGEGTRGAQLVAIWLQRSRLSIRPGVLQVACRAVRPGWCPSCLFGSSPSWPARHAV